MTAVQCSPLLSLQPAKNTPTAVHMQDRVTDHRCGVVFYNLEALMASGTVAAESLDRVHQSLSVQRRIEALQAVVHDEQSRPSS